MKSNKTQLIAVCVLAAVSLLACTGCPFDVDDYGVTISFGGSDNDVYDYVGGPVFHGSCAPYQEVARDGHVYTHYPCGR